MSRAKKVPSSSSVPSTATAKPKIKRAKKEEDPEILMALALSASLQAKVEEESLREVEYLVEIGLEEEAVDKENKLKAMKVKEEEEERMRAPGPPPPPKKGRNKRKKEVVAESRFLTMSSEERQVYLQSRVSRIIEESALEVAELEDQIDLKVDVPEGISWRLEQFVNDDNKLWNLAHSDLETSKESLQCSILNGSLMNELAKVKPPKPPRSQMGSQSQRRSQVKRKPSEDLPPPKPLKKSCEIGIQTDFFLQNCTTIEIQTETPGKVDMSTQTDPVEMVNESISVEEGDLEPLEPLERISVIQEEFFYHDEEMQHNMQISIMDKSIELGGPPQLDDSICILSPPPPRPEFDPPPPEPDPDVHWTTLDEEDLVRVLELQEQELLAVDVEKPKENEPNSPKKKSNPPKSKSKSSKSKKNDKSSVPQPSSPPPGPCTPPPRGSYSQVASPNNNQTPMLNYSLVDTPILKQEMKKYGLKALPRSKAKVLLRHIYEETHK